jgi:hypothetical protein
MFFSKGKNRLKIKGKWSESLSHDHRESRELKENESDGLPSLILFHDGNDTGRYEKAEDEDDDMCCAW